MRGGGREKESEGRGEKESEGREKESEGRGEKESEGRGEGKGE